MTNVITGFLGAGKSTAILHLLQTKPPEERWAVLVNEFGEVGIDGTLLQEHEGQDLDVLVREVPGGCMCCTGGLPMQVALTTLLSRARPDRLLIEPTGLGHPQEVLELLRSEYYRKAIDLRATVTLVDARKIQDFRYTDHPTFVQQLAVADIVVANKADRYAERDLTALRRFMAQTKGVEDKRIVKVEHGALQLEWLAPQAGAQRPPDHSHSHGAAAPQESASLDTSLEIPETGYLCIDNEGEGFFSRGWIFDPSWVFDLGKLQACLLGVDAERIKGVFITEQAASTFNMADGVMTHSTLPDCADSRVEVLARDQTCFEGLERALLSCVISPPQPADRADSGKNRPT